MNEKKQPKRRRRWMQFSLRSMFLFTAAVALWATWYRQPKLGELDMGDGMVMHVNRHMKKETLPVPDGSYEVEVLTKQGPFVLRDKHGRVLCRGKFQKDLPSGTWTYYHNNGRRAMTGQCRKGVRVGLWRAWYENGRKRFEIQHGEPIDMPDFRGGGWGFGPGPGMRGQPSGGYFSVPPGPVTANGVTRAMPLRGLRSSTLYQLAPPGSVMPYSPYSYPPSGPEKKSNRHGPSRWWWDNGHLRMEGPFQRDRRGGVWTFYDRLGNKTAKGLYHQGNRDGKWAVWDKAAKSPRVVHYAGGRVIDDYDAVVSRLAGQVKSSSWQQRFDAVVALSRLDSKAIAHIAPAFQDDNQRLRQLALQTAERMGAEAKPLLARIRPLEKDASRAVRIDALFAVDALDKSERSRVLRQLIVEANQGDSTTVDYIASRLDVLESTTLLALEKMLDDEKLGHATIAVLQKMAVDLLNILYEIDDSELSAVLKRAAKHRDPIIAKRAAEALKYLESGGFGIQGFGSNLPLVGCIW